MDLTATRNNFDAKVPKSGIRLDDRSAAIGLLTQSSKLLNENWAAEIDYAGMICDARVPLGHPYKKFFLKGTVDMDGILTTEDAWCYM